MSFSSSPCPSQARIVPTPYFGCRTLLPRVFSKVHPRFRTPHVSTWIAGLVVAIPSGLFDIGTLSELSNIGTLFAFILVALGVLVLRYKQPERRRGFKTPWVPAVPVAAIICCLILMASLPIETWLRFLIWLVIGLVIYLSYSRFHSEFAKPAPAAVAAGTRI